MPFSTVGKKGEVALPTSVRKHLGLSNGDRVEIAFRGDSEVVIRKISRPVEELRGLLRRMDSASPTLEQLKTALLDDMSNSSAIVARERES